MCSVLLYKDMYFSSNRNFYLFEMYLWISGLDVFYVLVVLRLIYLSTFI